MAGIFSVRNSLLLIAGIGTALLLALGGGIWHQAQRQTADASRLQTSNVIEGLLLKSAFHWASERTLTQAALFSPEPVQPWNQQAIKEHRRTADEAFMLAVGELEGLVTDKGTAAALDNTRDLHAAINALRERLDAALENGFDARDKTTISSWFPSVTGLVAASQELRQEAQFQASAALRDLEALQAAKGAVAAMWEAGQCEAGLIAGVIAADDPLVLEDVERLAEFRGQLIQAWREVESYARREEAIPAIVEQITHVREDYFAAFERIRDPILVAGMEGDVYPVSAVEWIHQSDAAITPLFRLGELYETAAFELTAQKQAEGKRNLILASILLATTVLIGVGTFWIVIFWIVRPLGRITQAMTALAAGEENVEVPATAARNEIGDMVRAVGSFKDSLEEKAREITQANLDLQSLNEELEDRVRQRTDELRLTRDEAVQANRAKSQFLANMSHELRTPLNAIIGFSEVLSEKVETKGPKDFKDPLHRIAAAGQHLLRLINDVLDIAKIEAGKMELSLEAVALPPMFEEVAKTIRPLSEQNGNRLTISCDSNISPVMADPTRLRQILLNLLSNAVKFTENGDIELSALDEKGKMLIAVADNGIGMTPQEVDNVFIEFIQADSSSTRKHGGTGLGLAISQRFCRIMGGEITVDSVVGEGTTFRVFLPVAERGVKPAESRQKRQPLPEQAVAEVAEPAGVPADGRTPLVLSIDDDKDVLDLLELVLENEGYRLITARSGPAGLKLAKTLKPDIVTLDVKMPDMDGWDMLAALKANEDTRQIPVVMLTIVDEATRGYALGATEYLVKPIEREPLLAAMARVVGTRKKPSVLLVEDDEPTRAMVREMLDGDCSSFVEAADGQEALERLAEARPDVILLDLLMPRMDGFDFLEALRAEGSNHSIPVIVVTAKDLTAEDHERLAGAVTRILQKNALSGTALLSEIRSAVRNGLAQGGWTNVGKTAAAGEAAAGSEAPARSKVRRILYVEDNEDNIVLLHGRLEDRGFAVSIARDGREGVNLARAERPDVILMDMSLPVMDGWEAARELKADPTTAAIPIIGVSAHAMAGDRDKALEAGCDDYVTKPIDIDELLQKASALMGNGQAGKP